MYRASKEERKSCLVSLLELSQGRFYLVHGLVIEGRSPLVRVSRSSAKRQGHSINHHPIPIAATQRPTPPTNPTAPPDPDLASLMTRIRLSSSRHIWLAPHHLSLSSYPTYSPIT